MSLLSENVATVAQANTVVSQNLTLITPPITVHMPLLNSVYKQVVGYVAPRGEEYTYVMDVATGKPLELPDVFVPMGISLSAVQALPVNIDDPLFYLYFVNSTTIDGSLALLAGNVPAHDINSKAFVAPVEELGLGIDYGEGYKWLAFQNNNYPTPLPSGVVKVIVQYI